jgi:hypothetical protein
MNDPSGGQQALFAWAIVIICVMSNILAVIAMKVLRPSREKRFTVYLYLNASILLILPFLYLWGSKLF